MATYQMVQVRSLTAEKPDYNATAETNSVWSVALGTALLLNDTIIGPTIPNGNYLTGITVDTARLDTSGSPTLTFEVGVAGTLGAFIASGNTIAQTGGIVHTNVPGAIGWSATTDSPILVTITAAPATFAAGTMRMRARFTPNP